MLQPRQPVARDSLPAATSANSAAAGQTADRQLGERVRSLSLARLPQRHSSLLTTAAWIIGTFLLAAGTWYGYLHFVAARPIEAQAVGTEAGRRGASTDKTDGRSGPQRKENL